jgi:hypothetical protein
MHPERVIMVQKSTGMLNHGLNMRNHKRAATRIEK